MSYIIPGGVGPICVLLESPRICVTLPWRPASHTHRAPKVRSKAHAAAILSLALTSLVVSFAGAKPYIQFRIVPHVSTYHQVRVRTDSPPVLAACNLPARVYQ